MISPALCYFSKIDGREENDGHLYYQVLYKSNEYGTPRILFKRYSDFEAFDEQLKKFNFKGLPQLPGKLYFSTEAKLNER